MTSFYISTQTRAEFKEQVSETWDQDLNYKLLDVEYIGGRWTGVFADNGFSDDNINIYTEAPDFATLQSQIQERWAEDYDLIDLDYVDETWIAVFDNSTLLRGGAYSLSADLDEFVEKTQGRFDDGYQLANVEYADGHWVSIFDQSLGGSSVNFTDNFTGMTEVIQERREEGFDLVGVEYAEETWVGVFKEVSYLRSAYSVTSDRGEFNQSLAEFTEAGYDLIDFERVDDQWVGVYGQTDSTLAELDRTTEFGLEAALISLQYSYLNLL